MFDISKTVPNLFKRMRENLYFRLQIHDKEQIEKKLMKDLKFRRPSKAIAKTLGNTDTKQIGIKQFVWKNRKGCTEEEFQRTITQGEWKDLYEPK